MCDVVFYLLLLFDSPYRFFVAAFSCFYINFHGASLFLDAHYFSTQLELQTLLGKDLMKGLSYFSINSNTWQIKELWFIILLLYIYLKLS